MKFNTFKPLLKCMSHNFGESREFLSKLFEPANPELTICEESDKKVPLVILVFACATIPKYKDEIRTIEETWGADAKRAGIPVYFMLGEEKTELEGPQYIYLEGVDNTYESAKLKQFIGHIMLCRSYNPDMLFICGSDTFVNIPKLLQTARLFNPDVPMLIGNDGFHKHFGPLHADFLSGGGGLLTTRAANRLMIPYCDTICEKWSEGCTVFRSDLSAASDVMLSFLAHYLGIEFIQAFGFYHTSWKAIDAIQGPIDIKQIVTCHNMTRQDCIDFYEVLKANKFFIV